MSLLRELLEANDEAKREVARRKAAKAKSALGGGPADGWEQVAVMPTTRFAPLRTPIGVVSIGLFLLLLAFPQGLLPVRPDAFLIDALQVIFRYIIIVTGLNIIAGYTGQLSLGQGVFVSIGAYTSAIVTTKLAGTTFGEPWVGFFAAVVLGAVFGAVIGVPSLRVRGAFLAVVTLAFVYIFEKIYGYRNFAGLFGSTEGIKDVATPIGERLSLFGYRPTDIDWFYVHLAMAAVLVFLTRNLVRSRWGRGLMAVRESEIAAKSCGVNVTRYKTTAFVISAVFASIAGFLYVHSVGFVSPPFPASILESFRYVVMLIVGGNGSLLGPVLGATSIEVLTRMTSKFVEYQRIILGVIAIVTVWRAPLGLAGMLQKMATRFRLPGIKLAGVARAEAAQVPESMRLPRVRSAAGDRSGDVVLEASEMSKIFGSLRANNKVNIEVRRGTVHSLIGPNGSGKTTFINTVTGVYTADEGEVKFQGERCDDRALHENVQAGMGRTFQNLQLWRRMTVLENVMVGLHSRMHSGLFACMLHTPEQRREEARMRERAYGLLTFCGIERFASLPAGQLPYGPQRLLEIARALALDPVFLILDEPAAGLNPSESHELTGLIRRIADSGITVFLIEHHMDIVMNVSDRVTVLDFGNRIADGTPAEVQADPKVLAAYLGGGDEKEEAPVAVPVPV